jgi:cytoskeletal protein CcmA (bactofilin family)
MKTRNGPASSIPEGITPHAPWSLIGPGSAVQGELLMAGNVLIHGRVEGIVFTDGEVRVAPGGAVEGGIHARRITVEGSCEGRVEATEEVVLLGGAVVRGDVDAEILLVDDGARFFGNWLRGDRNPGPRILSNAKPSGTA